MQNTAVKIVKKLKEKGFRAFFAGGCVRDLILKKNPQDFDIATDAQPEEIEAIFVKTYPIGKAFGVILIEEDGHNFEVATFRSDSGASDGRRPNFITFSSPQEDAFRRDFTINGIFYDPLIKEFYDFVDGRRDLKRGLLRFIGDAEERIEEDFLRILRAVRFKNRFKLDYCDKTRKALEKHASLVTHVSAERVTEELNKILVHHSRVKAIQDLSDLGILIKILPEVEKQKEVPQPKDFHIEGDVFHHMLLVLKALGENESQELYWSAFLHDIGKAETLSFAGDRIHFHHHQEEGTVLVQKISERLKFSRKKTKKIMWLVKNHHLFDQFSKMKMSTKLIYFDHPFFSDLMKLHRADILGCQTKDSKNREKALLELTLIEENFRYAHSERILPSHKKDFFSGKEIMELLNIPAGPELGAIKDALREQQLEDVIKTKEEAKVFLKTFLKENISN
ncbi:CCA tRNA nucleotidyltransferase [Candidatus Gracilibacteria bacterium]|nr:CCA tRNA nucleotidyltransferase [Candidatus Gracilibacteria bacterium]